MLRDPKPIDRSGRSRPGRPLAAAWLLVAGLGLTACGTPAEPGSRLDLRFARQAIDGPCPETVADDPAPPALDGLEVVLTRSDGKRHWAKTISLGDKPAVRLSGISPGEDLELSVTGTVGGSPQWGGAAAGVTIREGRATYADVFLTRLDDVSCASRTLHRPRALLAAAQSSSGPVVLAGGIEQRQADACGPGCDEWLASSAVDLFDADTGVIYTGRRLHTPRALATATALPGGGVLVVGGARRVRTGSGAALPLAVDPADLVETYEVYLPDQDIWIEKPLPGRQGRVFHSATALPDGRVLIVGGGTSFDDARDDALLFDPAGESVGDFELLSDRLATPRLGQAAVLVGDRVLILGGAVLPTKSPVEEFSFSGDQGVFSEVTVGGSPFNPFFHTAIVLPLRPDEILIAGGAIDDGASGLQEPAADNARIYSISRAELSQAGTMELGRLMPRLVALGNDTVLVAGGFHGLDLQPDDTLEIFNPAGSFQTETSLSTPRGGQAVVAIEGGRALLVGGQGPDGLLGSGEVFTPPIAP